MGLFTKGVNAESKEVKLSAELCKKRDALAATWPQVQAKWSKVDDDEVMPAAQRLSVASFTQNAERIMEARESLRKAVWSRDGIKSDFQRSMDELNAEIEMLSGPVISAKSLEWQTELSGLRGHKIVETVERFADMRKERTPVMVKYRSNFATISEAKEILGPAIRELREMRQKPLSLVHAFIEKVETKLRGLDLDALAESKEPVSESTYAQIIAAPDVQVQRNTKAVLRG
jgi:hypothetical protein